MKALYKQYFGPITFYRRVSLIAIPLALQQLLTSCMGIVDSLMVSWIDEVSAVGTAVQVETLCSAVAWGAIAGTGIFASQFYGAGRIEKLRKTFGLSLILGFLDGVFWLLAAAFLGKWILGFYMSDLGVIESGWTYLSIAMFSYIPNVLAFAFSYMYRCIHKTSVPLIIGGLAMGVNILVNDILMFGKLGFPAMGVAGAAFGTLAAQSLALLAHVWYAFHTKQVFMGSLSAMFHLPKTFVAPILRKLSPLVMNELMFGFGSTLFVKAFGALGTDAMDAYYVGAKISDIFTALVNGISTATAALLGVRLGANQLLEAKKEGDYFVGMASVLTIVSTFLIFVFSDSLVGMFQLQKEMVHTAAIMIVKVFSIKVALRLFIVIIFSALRAGGDSKMLAMLDSGLLWLVGLPIAFASVQVFHMQDIALVFLITQIEQLIRVIVGMLRYQSKSWIVNLTLVS